MALILDTNAFSALADGDVKLERVLGREDLALTVVVLGEYWYGVQQSRNRAEYEAWIENRQPRFELLGVSRTTARHYANICQELRVAGRPILDNDMWIAAAAREHDMPIVTRDRHFGAIRGLQVVSW